jgi:hypothetical protein
MINNITSEDSFREITLNQGKYRRFLAYVNSGESGEPPLASLSDRQDRRFFRIKINESAISHAPDVHSDGAQPIVRFNEELDKSRI